MTVRKKESKKKKKSCSLCEIVSLYNMSGMS